MIHSAPNSAIAQPPVPSDFVKPKRHKHSKQAAVQPLTSPTVLVHTQSKFRQEPPQLWEDAT